MAVPQEKLTARAPAGFSDERSIPSLGEDLQAMALEDLRAKWCEVYAGTMMPKGLPRDILIRSIAWVVQCDRYGGLAPGVRAALDKMARQLAVSGTLDIERAIKPKAGTRLIREWRGRTYLVEVADSGFLHEGRTFASLSHVARAITGTQWSGPRFFGLKPKELASLGPGEG